MLQTAHTSLRLLLKQNMPQNRDIQRDNLCSQCKFRPARKMLNAIYMLQKRFHLTCLHKFKARHKLCNTCFSFLFSFFSLFYTIFTPACTHSCPLGPHRSVTALSVTRRMCSAKQQVKQQTTTDEQHLQHIAVCISINSHTVWSCIPYLVASGTPKTLLCMCATCDHRVCMQ